MVDIAEAATRKIGPLPAWAWGAVVGGGLLVYRLATGGGSGGASSSFVQPIAGGTPFDYDDHGATGGGGGTTTPTPTTPSPTTGGGSGRVPIIGGGRGSGPGTAGGRRALVPGGASRPLGGPRPGSLGSGDTGASVPLYGALSGTGIPVLGMPFDRAAAVDAAASLARTDWIGPAPDVPSYPIHIPGTLVPKSPPILSAQGDASRVVPLLDPRAAMTALRDAIRTATPPTTRPPSLAVPQRVRDIAGRFRPTFTG